MFEKLIGVSPPQKGKAQESKQVDDKNLRGSSKSEYKKDFEKALEKKLAQKKEVLQAKKEETRKDENSKLAETRAERKDAKLQSKSLGGSKKKVTEDDDKMVSNIAASSESKIETPVNEEKPAKIEVESSNKESSSDSNVLAMETKSSLAAGIANPVGKSLVESNILSETASVVSDKPVVAKDLLMMNTAELKPISADLAGIVKPELAPQVVEKSPLAGFSMEKELGESVGFEANSKLQKASSQLVERLKSFDVDKGITSNKLQSFEKDVLNQLQKDRNLSIQPAINADGLKQEMGSFENKESDIKKDLKAELGSTYGLHQAANQSHSDFKSQLNVANVQNSTSLAKLEENREANINEVMKQAQYLVKNGGGEVSVKMSPEGMGDVHLKVLLVDGKLNIEMQTQNKDVKKLIEESLSDLKSGLAAHRLSLEHVKIDTVSATNADNNTQFQSNLNHSGSDGRARDFWNEDSNFQMNQQKQNSSHSDSSSHRQAPNRINSSVASAAQALRTYGGTKGASINRVA